MTQVYSLMVAPNGARRGKADHPALPVTIDELAETARACHFAGADAIHLHVRDADRLHSLDPGLYREAMAAIEDRAPGMGIQVTTESGGIYDVPAQLACLDALRPGAASIAVREMTRNPGAAARVYALARETGTRVQHILYSPVCIAQFNDWRDRGTIRERAPEVILVLGQYQPPLFARPEMLAPLRANLGGDVNWTVCAFGRTEQACLIEALRLGGQVRIGFENNIETPDGAPLADNTASVHAFVATARAQGFKSRRCAADAPA